MAGIFSRLVPFTFQYELVCEREAYGTITETAVMVCGMIGAILFAYITDR